MHPAEFLERLGEAIILATLVGEESSGLAGCLVACMTDVAEGRADGARRAVEALLADSSWRHGSSMSTERAQGLVDASSAFIADLTRSEEAAVGVGVEGPGSDLAEPLDPSVFVLVLAAQIFAQDALLRQKALALVADAYRIEPEATVHIGIRMFRVLAMLVAGVRSNSELSGNASVEELIQEVGLLAPVVDVPLEELPEAARFGLSADAEQIQAASADGANGMPVLVASVVGSACALARLDTTERERDALLALPLFLAARLRRKELLLEDC